jgi:5-methyltetrahydropteroyltriglutamate--homocysteine methyltransferase
VTGAYPKISDEHQELRRALHRHDRGELDGDGLTTAFDESTRWAIGELEWAGVDVVNDGQIRWDDALAPFARAWEGCERGPLERFYDNNTYFRQPVITGPITTTGTTLVRDFEFARGVVRGQLKGAVCGPLTFATLAAEDRHYRTLEDRTLAVADALTAEIRGLGAAGATLVDVEEPALVAHPEHFALARAAFERLAAAGVPLALHAYFFPADPLLDALGAFPVAQVGIDVRSRETHVLEKLNALRQTIVLGIVDARNTRVESERELVTIIESALKQIPAEYLWLAPTTSLEYLPHDVAVQKLKALVAAAHATGGVRA